MKKTNPQRDYYWRYREQILKKNAKLAKDPEYRKKRQQIALKSYYKRKAEKDEGRNC